MTILFFTIAYIIGIIMGLYIKSIALFLAFFLVLFIGYVILRSLNKLNHIKIHIVLLCFFIVLFGFIYIRNMEFSFQNKYNGLINNDENNTSTFEAIVISNGKEGNYSKTWLIKVLSVNGNKKDYKGTQLYLRIKGKKQNINYGDRIVFEGEYEEASSQRNYGGFDYREYLKTKKVYGIVVTKSIDKIEKQSYSKILILINSISNKIVEKSNTLFNKDEASVLTGLLIGNKDNLDNNIKEDFRKSSLSHLLAVSGAHVTYILVGIIFLCSRANVNKRASKFFIILFLLFFIVLTGSTPSVERACFMAIYVLIAQLIHKKPSIVSGMCLSLLLILIPNPYKIMDIGLQLSYGGTIGILLFSKLFIEDGDKTNLKSVYKKEPLKRRIIRYVKNMLIVSISANLLIIPIIAYHFNTFSLMFIISNIMAGSILGIIIGLGFFSIIISFIPFLFFISKILSLITSLLLKLLLLISKICGSISIFSFYVKTPSVLIIVLYYWLLTIIYKRVEIKKNNRIIINKNITKNIKNNIRKNNKKRIIVMIIIIILFNVFSISIKQRDFKLYFVDVGQGDCTLIVTPKNKTILIDGGGSSDESYDVGKRVLIPYLLDRGITKLDYIIISHFDSDHVGGILTVMEELKVKSIIISKQITGSDNYERFKTIVNRKYIDVKVINKNDSIKIEKDINMYFLWPDNDNYITDNPLNNNSILCKLYYKNISILFTGDIEKIAEGKIVDEYTDKSDYLESTILKVGHHGSKTSSTEELINLIKPKIALIGVGENNKFGHPNAEVIERLKNSGAIIYRTDKMGEIEITIDRKCKIKTRTHINVDLLE